MSLEMSLDSTQRQMASCGLQRCRHGRKEMARGSDEGNRHEEVVRRSGELWWKIRPEEGSLCDGGIVFVLQHYECDGIDNKRLPIYDDEDFSQSTQRKKQREREMLP